MGSCILLLIASALTGAEPASETPADTLEQVRQKHAKLSAALLNIVEPVEITEVAIGAPEEAAVHGVLLRWVNRHAKKDHFLTGKEIAYDAADPHLWEIQVFFNSLEKRFVRKEKP